MQDQRIAFLQKEIDKLERQLFKHAPPGSGVEAAFGHKRSGGTGRFFLRPDVMFTLPFPEGRMTNIVGGEQQAGIHIRSLPQDDSDRLWLVFNLDDQAAFCDYVRVAGTNGYQYTEYTHDSGGWQTFTNASQAGILADGDVFVNPGTSTGDFYIVAKHPGGGCQFESIDMNNIAGGWSSVTLSGGNAPGCGLNTRQKICNLGNNKCVVMANNGTLYWGDVTSATAISFTDSTTTSSRTFGTTVNDTIHLNSDGTVLIIADPIVGQWSRHTFETHTVSGHTQTDYNSHWTFRKPVPASGASGSFIGYVKINGFWCSVNYQQGPSTIWVQSQGVLSNPA